MEKYGLSPTFEKGGAKSIVFFVWVLFKVFAPLFLKVDLHHFFLKSGKSGKIEMINEVKS